MEPDIWLAFFVAALLISISPGAGAVNTMSSGLQYGVKDSLPAIFGLQLGYGAQIILVGIGLGALLASSSLAFNIVKWLGVFYLVYLGYRKWTQAPREIERVAADRESRSRRFWQAAFVNLTNPKATVFLLALFPQFIDPQAPSQALQFTIMGTTLILVDIGVMLGYASLAAQLSRWMRSRRRQVLQNRVFGGMFIGAATLMASYRHV
jgi:homoserine/homoserine lactone efflux protein